jgi:hypothetical protein
MNRKIKRVLRKEEARPKNGKTTSYDTSREETSTPQKIREGNEPEAIRQRAAKSK